MKWALLETLVALLMLGAIVNIAVAWCCVLGPATREKFARSGYFDGIGIQPRDEAWIKRPLDSKKEWAALYTIWNTSNGVGLERRIFRFTNVSGNTDPVAERLRAGWPCPSMEGERWLNWSKWPILARRRDDHYSYEWSIRVPTWLLPENRQIDAIEPGIPLKPLWSGFMLNTLFYAIVIWLFAAAAARLRRLGRAASGCCARCGYDLRGQTSAVKTCPECGFSSSSRSPAASHRHSSDCRR